MTPHWFPGNRLPLCSSRSVGFHGRQISFELPLNVALRVDSRSMTLNSSALRAPSATVFIMRPLWTWSWLQAFSVPALVRRWCASSNRERVARSCLHSRPPRMSSRSTGVSAGCLRLLRCYFLVRPNRLLSTAPPSRERDRPYECDLGHHAGTFAVLVERRGSCQRLDSGPWRGRRQAMAQVRPGADAITMVM
jgi:hypothetical protein